jgi:hypothetical protein
MRDGISYWEADWPAAAEAAGAAATAGSGERYRFVF